MITNDNAEGGLGESTSAPITASEPRPRVAAGIEPEFYAMPGPGHICPYSGLRRGALYCLWRDREIETISVRRKGRSRGRRLIVGESLRRYLRRLHQEQNGGPESHVASAVNHEPQRSATE